MILLMMVAGVNLSAEAPTNVSYYGRVTCPAGKSLVSIDQSHQGCCPSCPVGKVARANNGKNSVCSCIDQAYIDQRYNECINKKYYSGHDATSYCTEWAG